MATFGIDLGFNEVKIIGDHGRLARFPSVVGSVDRSRFSLSNTTGLILTAPDMVAVGSIALEQSRWLRRREDRAWHQSEEWRLLLLAAISEVYEGSGEAVAVLGLPVSHYNDAAAVRDRVLGLHRFQREGRRAQSVTLSEVRVVPQPFGALLDAVLDDTGQIAAPDLARSRVAVLDVGGKTTNLLSARNLSEVRVESSSVDLGGWDVVRALSEYLATNAPGLRLRDHEVAACIRDGGVAYYGNWLDLRAPLRDMLQPMADTIIADVTQLWNGAAQFSAVLITGGGAYLLGDHLAAHFPQARIVPEPVTANARGFYKLARRLNND